MARFDLSASSGDLQVWAEDSQQFDTYKGSILRVQGVCSAACNARHQLTGIELWSPDLRFMLIEEAAPVRLFLFDAGQ